MTQSSVSACTRSLLDIMMQGTLIAVRHILYLADLEATSAMTGSNTMAGRVWSLPSGHHQQRAPNPCTRGSAWASLRGTAADARSI